MVMLIAPVEVTRPQGWLHLQTRIGAAALWRIPHRWGGRCSSHAAPLQPWYHLQLWKDKEGVLRPKALPASGNLIGTQWWIWWNGIFSSHVDNLCTKAKFGARAELLSQPVLPGVDFWGMKRSVFALVWGWKGQGVERIFWTKEDKYFATVLRETLIIEKSFWKGNY